MKASASMLILGIISLSLMVISTVYGELASQEDLGALRREIEDLKEGQKAIREDLKAIKGLLSASQKARDPVQEVERILKVSDDPTKGNRNATLTLIEFTDYQCPFCGRHTRSVLPQIEKELIDTGKIRYVLRDFPLSSIHPQAAKAHEAAHCAGEQGKYWEMHDQLFANQKDLEADKLVGHAQAAGVSDAPAFQACLDSGKYEARLKASLKEGTEAGIRGTPSFLLGQTKPKGTVKAVKLIRGAQPFPVFQQQIDALLDPEKTE